MFIRRKIVNGTTYYAVVESYRKDGKVRQRTLFSMGRDSSFDPNIDRLTKHIADLKANPELLAMLPMVGLNGRRVIAEHEERLKVLQDWKGVVTKNTKVGEVSENLALNAEFNTTAKALN
jgi:hypothetical protein